MPSSPPSNAQPIVRINAYAQTIVLLFQLFFPNKLYNSHTSRFISHYTALPSVELVEANSPAHSLLLALGFATLSHVWQAAQTTRKHAHASTALAELIYAVIALGSCLPIFPRQYGSSISVIGSIPNFIFPALICYYGNIGWRDFVRLFQGDDAIRTLDVPKEKGVRDKTRKKL